MLPIQQIERLHRAAQHGFLPTRRHPERALSSDQRHTLAWLNNGTVIQVKVEL
jgi:hypothetical protein